jgi:hypothetical protein
MNAVNKIAVLPDEQGFTKEAFRDTLKPKETLRLRMQKTADVMGYKTSTHLFGSHKVSRLP